MSTAEADRLQMDLGRRVDRLHKSQKRLIALIVAAGAAGEPFKRTRAYLDAVVSDAEFDAWFVATAAATDAERIARGLTPQD